MLQFEFWFFALSFILGAAFGTAVFLLALRLAEEGGALLPALSEKEGGGDESYLRQFENFMNYDGSERGQLKLEDGDKT
ncbi:MAG: hypothetical protein Q4B42_04935 [Oscillospiraceae bacterium]|nr:hypothetical protein [Oscillospiraceae bacterium]